MGREWEERRERKQGRDGIYERRTNLKKKEKELPKGNQTGKGHIVLRDER